MGTKPFLCLKGKPLKGNLSRKKTVSVKDRIKHFEVEANDVIETKVSKGFTVESDRKSEKIKRMLSLYENGSPLIKKVVHEPDKNLEDTKANTRNDEVKIRNAFEILMANGDTRIRTPGKVIMKAKKSSAANRRKV